MPQFYFNTGKTVPVSNSCGATTILSPTVAVARCGTEDTNVSFLLFLTS